MKKTTYTLLSIGAVAFAAASLLSACVKENPDSPGFEYMPDMYRSPSAETNMANQYDSILVNGVWLHDTTLMYNMTPPDGTIPRGFTPFPYANTVQGDSLASKFWMNPLEHSDKIEEEGKLLYERNCIYCHGPKGDGNGKLVESGKYSSTPPDYAKRLGEGLLTDGHVYFVITYGIRNMGSHATQLNPEERWKVIEYVQRLGRGGAPWSQYEAEKNKPAADSTAKAQAAAPAPANNK